jgi:glycosyltransferase involved in cell wall biosynthesis
MSNRRLRVAFDNSMAGRSRTGTGVYTTQLIRHLHSLPDLELNVIQEPQDLRTGRGLLGYPVQVVRRLDWYQRKLPQWLKQERFDVFHGPAFFVPLRCPCPSVVTVLDLTTFLFPKQFDPRFRFYLNTLLPRILRNASAVMAISEHSRQDLLRIFSMDPAKVHVTYPGIDHARFRPEIAIDPKLVHRIGLRSDYVLHVGTLVTRKNIPALLRAVAKLRSAGRWGDLQLVLAGPETPGVPGAAEIREEVKRLELEEVTVFTGHVDDEQLPGLYANARMLVMPSSYEGFGFPVLESMASGTPVIASNISSLPEIAGDAALLFAPDDVDALAKAIHEILTSPTAAATLRERGLKQAAGFTWERTAQETARIYLAAI